MKFILFNCFFWLAAYNQLSAQISSDYTCSLPISFAINMDTLLLPDSNRIDSIRFKTNGGNVILEVFLEENDKGYYGLELLEFSPQPANEYFELHPELVHINKVKNNQFFITITNDFTNNHLKYLGNQILFTLQIIWLQSPKALGKFLGVIPPTPAIYSSQKEPRLNKWEVNIVQSLALIGGTFLVADGLNLRSTARNSYRNGYLFQRPPAPNGSSYDQFVTEKANLLEVIEEKEQKGLKRLRWGVSILMLDTLYFLYRFDRKRIHRTSKKKEPTIIIKPLGISYIFK